MKKDNFEFWCELNSVEKAVDEKTGEEIMLLGGIASTADEDSDGEFLDPKGFDIQPLLKSGLVNWHHQAKTNPGTIVGEPTKAEIRKEGLYIETQLYPHSQVACDIWELAKTLAKDSKTRRLGYSIEGRVVKRKSDDPTDPDYKKIVKAIITGVAITHQPKNPKTFANIIKGDIDDDFEEESEDIKEKEEKTEEDKAVDTETAAALKKESVDDNLKVTTFGKSEVYDKIFQDIPGISISKAEKIYSLIEKIALMKKDSKAITNDDIKKAYEALGLDAPVLDDIKKGDDADEETAEDVEETEVEETEDDEDVKKAEDVNDEDEPEDDEDSEDEDEEENDSEDFDEEDEVEEKEVKKAKTNSIGLKFERIEKAIAASHNSQSKYVKALGVIVKAQSIQLEKAQESLNLAIETINKQDEVIKGYEDQLASISDQIADLGSSVPAPKSIRHARAVERVFGKAQEDELEKGGDDGQLKKNQVSIKNRAAVAEILDQATFAKGGYDEEFGKACTAYEAGADIPASVISRIKNEFNIEIIK